ncbi:MAG: hypothetical protein LQ341_002457 [Variospora aurantia]|nr:MAG: hypothetical protein LQ341_002457 [Variospora aurantia]
MEAAQVRLEGLAMTIKSFFQSSHTPSVYPTLPPLSLLNIFPPPSEPHVLPPPVHDTSFAKPFNISSEVYNNALHVSVPITFALLYVLLAAYLNKRNRERDNKPWAFSKTSVFYLLVFLHNSFLTLYSAWTFLGMANALKHTWPGWEGEHKLARSADALCKLHGPRGYGSAATFNRANNAWSFTDRVMKLDQGLPDTTDVGRLWNEGLAFYGWLFYLSKFYEIVDTFIILAKGKNTAFFQTYHHAGAMFCVWSGIRYMSPPIWIFVTVNSAIHTLMYAYYALSSLGIQVLPNLKALITTPQIVQIIFGATIAIAHLFIAYDIPVETPYLFVHNLSSALPTAASSVSSAIASATASADIGSWLKKAALRAAGEEGLAENVRNSQGRAFGIDAVHSAEVERAQEETRYKLQYRTVNCLDTPGQTFAILLNFFYLVPLTVMFVNFFIRTYLKKSRSSSPPSTTENVQQSSKSALKDSKREWEEAMAMEQNDQTTNESEVPSKVSSQTNKINKGVKDLGDKVKDVTYQANEILQDRLQAATDTTSEKVNELNRSRHDAANSNGSNLTKKETQEEPDVGDGPEESKVEREQQDKPKAKNTKDAAPQSTDASSEKESNKLQDNAPKFEPPAASDSLKKSKSRSVSPQKKTQLPRPRSPIKKDSPPVGEEKSQVNGDNGSKQQPKEDVADASEILKKEKQSESSEETNSKNDAPESKPSSLDESAYEINPDELKDGEEKRAEEEMQPKPE